MDPLKQPPVSRVPAGDEIPIVSQSARGHANHPNPVGTAQAAAPFRLFSRTTLWAVCILSAFVATHLPPPPRPSSIAINDKLLHFVGFAVIGLLTVWRLAVSNRRFGFKPVAAWYGFILLYGLFDEATQELVKRSFEWSDWLADGAGAAVGMAIGTVAFLKESRNTV